MERPKILDIGTLRDYGGRTWFLFFPFFQRCPNGFKYLDCYGICIYAREHNAREKRMPRPGEMLMAVQKCFAMSTIHYHVR